MRIRRALGTPEAYLAGFTGSGVFRGRVRGTLDVPVFEGRVSGKDIGWLGVVWGRAEWVGVADAYVVRSHSLVVRRPGGELWVDGWAETGYYGEDDRIEIKARFDAWPASDFISALEWDLELTGPVSGEVVVRGRRSHPEGSARVSGPRGLYYGVPYTALDVDTAFEGAVGWGSGRATVGGGAVEFRGSLTDDGFFDGIAEATDVDVMDVLPAPSQAVAWGGRVSGRATLQGALARPRVVGQLSSKRIFLGDEGLGAVEATLRGDGDGTVSVAARCSSPRVDLAMAGSVGTMPPYPVSLEIAAQDTSLDPFVRLAYPKLHSALGVVFSGRLRLLGDAGSPQSLEANGQLSDFRLLLPDYPVRSRGPADLLVHDGRLALGRLHLSGEGTDLTLHGVAALLEDGPLELTLRGTADLRALSAVTRRLRGRGDARLSLDVKGTRDAPRIAGTLELEGAGIRARGFPHGIEGVRGSIRFTEAAAEFSEITGTIGGGAVELAGQATYEGGQLGTFEVQATGRGLSLRYPEGLRSQVDADIRLFGNAERQWVAGNVDVLQASWTRRYDLASEILSPREMLPERASLEEGLRYDVSLSAPGTLRIDNNLATLQARAELRLQGTHAHPVILGRAEVERGRVYFQGNTYVIRRGVIDFANPQEIDPFFDIEAETRLRSYRVTLRMNGTLERVFPTLSSDPPLSAVQILSLLAGADEADVASLMQVRTDQANLAATGAATLAAGRISEEVGLERGAERLFGLNRFSIDPSIIKGGVSNPTARLTVGKRLTPDLNVLYSIDLRGTEQRVLSVEYSLSDRLSLLITRNENPSETAFDLRLIRSY
jgi:translocation and assembly module TamB